VVAAENVWGDIASRVGGNRVEVTSIVTSPAADPHDYEPTAADARTMAEAQVAILNGVGYDTWASSLLDANPTRGRAVLNVGTLLGLEPGDNPHQWYSPRSVTRVVDAITADYVRADPGDRAYFVRRRSSFLGHTLDRYRDLLHGIRARYRGVAVGASESVFSPLARALGLRLVTPPGFLAAISEGAEPTPGDRAQVDRQIAEGQIAVWVYNSQNATPDVQRLNAEAKAAGLPVVTVTETPVPEGAGFAAWQSRQLAELRDALGRAVRR
jgi:zinc/manganese transport system substrate-binding protein